MDKRHADVSTLRDEIAMRAMQTVDDALFSYDDANMRGHFDEIARRAYWLADAMLAARREADSGE